MSNLPDKLIIANGDGDEPMSNESHNRHFEDVLAVNLSRRTALKGTLGTTIAAMFGGLSMAGCSTTATVSKKSLIGFSAVAISHADTVIVPKG